MEISNISRSSYATSSEQLNELSNSDLKKLDTILSKYDSENMDENSMSKLRAELKNANFTPGKSLAERITSAGFDPGELRPEGTQDANRVGGKQRQGRRPPPPPKADKAGKSNSSNSSNQLNVSILKPLSEILQSFDLNNLSDNDQGSLISQLQSKGILQTGLMIDLSA